MTTPSQTSPARAVADTVDNAAATPEKEQPYARARPQGRRVRADPRDPRPPPHERRAGDVLGDVVGALLVQVEQDLPAPVRREGLRRDEDPPHGRHGPERRRRRHRRGLGGHLQGRVAQPPELHRAVPGRRDRRRRHRARHHLDGRPPGRGHGPAALRRDRRPRHRPRRPRRRVAASRSTATASACPTSAARPSSTRSTRATRSSTPSRSACCATRTSSSRTRRGAGNKVVLFGARTGGDGIGGASILASDSFDRRRPDQAPRRAGRRPVRREGAHRVLPRAVPRRPRRGDPGPRRRRHLVRDERARRQRRQRHARRPREGAAARPDAHARGDPHEREPGAHDGDRRAREARRVPRGRRQVGCRDQRARRGHRRRPPRRSTGTARRSSTSTPSTVAVDGPVYERPVAYPTWIDALRDDSASALAPLGRPRHAARASSPSSSRARTSPTRRGSPTSTTTT